MKKTLFFVVLCYLFSACASKDETVIPTAFTSPIKTINVTEGEFSVLFR